MASTRDSSATSTITIRFELLGRERGKRMAWEATDAKKVRMAQQ